MKRGAPSRHDLIVRGEGEAGCNERMAKTDRIEVFEVIERAQSAGDPETLVALMRPAFERLGATAFVWGRATGPNGERAPRADVGETPGAWRAHYNAAQLAHRDPIFPRALRSPEPFTWRSARAGGLLPADGSEVLDQARSFGLEDGYVMPIHHLNGSTAAVVLYADQPLAWTPREGASAHMLAVYFAAISARLADAGSAAETNRVSLSRRQAECVQWVRAGKTDWEIGQILGLSEHTVAEHLEAARRRLGVKTRTQAVIEAISRGLIPI